MAGLGVSPAQGRGGLLAVALLLSAVLRTPYFQHEFVFVDEAWWANGGRLLAQGGRLYADILLDKNPPIFLFCAALFRWFGTNTLVMHAGALLLVAAVTILLFRIGSRFFSPSVGGVAAVVYAVASTTYYTPRIIGLNTETLMVVFTTGAVYALLRGVVDGRGGAFWAAGFLAALAIWTKPVAVTDAALLFGFGVACTGSRGAAIRWRAAAALAGGFAVGMLVFVAYLAGAGTLGLWWEQCILYGFRYVGGVAPSRFLHKLPRVAAGFGLIYAWLWILVLQSRGWAGDRERIAYRLAVGWIASALLGVVLGRRFYANYFIQAMPPLALVAAVGVAALFRNVSARSARRALAAVAATLFLSFSWFHAQTAAHWYLLLAPEEHTLLNAWGLCREDRLSRELAAHVKARTEPNARVFVWGAHPQLYFLADRRPATTAMDFDVGDDFLPGAGERAVRQATVQTLRAAPPAYLVDVQRTARLDGYAEFRQLVADLYELETEVRGVRVYRRRPPGMSIVSAPAPVD